MRDERWDVAVVGGGAAGLAAADALVRAGRRVVLCEARNRLGGRVFTDRGHAPVPIEWGAEFVHGGRVSTWSLIEQHTDEVLPSRTWYRRGEGWAATAAWEDEPRHLGQEAPEPGHDEDAATYLERLGLASPFLPPGAWTMHVDSEGPRRWSARAAQELGWFDAPDVTDPGDHVVTSGYDRILARLVSATQVRLGTRVREVARRDGGVTLRVESDGTSGTLTAAAAVVALPLGVLQAGDVAFDPDVPRATQEAITGLGMGDVAKLLYLLPRRVLPPDATVTVDVEADLPCFWSSGPAGGRDGELVVAWATGDGARRLLGAGRDEALAAGLEAMRETFGARDLVPVWSGFHDWSADPLTRGGYSFVPPGAHDARRVLAEPIDDRLVLAGEATDVTDAMTVHGALNSGRRAADQLLSVLDARAGGPRAAT